MPNENEHPRYTDPDHPYSGSGLRYQNNYNRNEYHAGDGPFQFPWWAIVIGFVVWWPLGFIFIGLNAAMKNGKLGSFEQKARTRTQSYRSGPSVQEGQFRPIYAQQDKESAGKTAAAPRDAEKKRKGMALANGLTAAGVLLLLGALAALPGGTYWLPDALTGDLEYIRWFLADMMPVFVSATAGVGCLFGAHHIRTSRRLRKRSTILSVMRSICTFRISPTPSRAAMKNAASTWKTASTTACSAPKPTWICAANVSS